MLKLRSVCILGGEALVLVDRDIGVGHIGKLGMNVLLAHFNLVFDAFPFAGINRFSAVNEKFQMRFTALQAVKIIAYDLILKSNETL